MKYYALIKDQIVEGVIIGEDSFISILADQYDSIVDVTDRSRPSPGDSYYLDVDTFISNTAQVTDIPVDLQDSHLQQGLSDGFDPFQISQYTVSYADGVITIGCKSYPAIGILDTLYKLLIEKQQTTTYFTSSPEGPAHGKFGITWDDAQKIYDALIQVKF